MKWVDFLPNADFEKVCDRSSSSGIENDDIDYKRQVWLALNRKQLSLIMMVNYYISVFMQ